MPEKETVVFETEHQRARKAVESAFKSYLDMLECVDEPVGLDYTTMIYGVRIRIDLTVE